MLASKGSDTKRWSQLNTVGKGMFYGDGLFLSSDNEKLQPHKSLHAGPQGAVRSVLAMHVRRYVYVCVCAFPLDLDAFIANVFLDICLLFLRLQLKMGNSLFTVYRNCPQISFAIQRYGVIASFNLPLHKYGQG